MTRAPDRITTREIVGATVVLFGLFCVCSAIWVGLLELVLWLVN